MYNILQLDELLKEIDSLKSSWNCNKPHEMLGLIEENYPGYDEARKRLIRYYQEGIGLTEQLIMEVNACVRDKNVLKVNRSKYRGRDAGIRDLSKLNSIPIYIAPPSKKIQSYIQNLIEWYYSSDVHPIIKVASFHYHFIKIHPFMDGNGRTVRLLTSFLLKSSGYSWHFGYGLEFFFKKNNKLTREKLTDGLKYNPSSDLTNWIDYFCIALIRVVKSNCCKSSLQSVNENKALSNLNTQENF
ncbi:MAG: hypothetical protein AMXMBFR12_02060 [Candidatus Babeliales bacterium]